MIEVWSCPTLSCIASFLIHITNYKTAPFSAPLFSVLLYVYNVNIPAKFEAEPHLPSESCNLQEDHMVDHDRMHDMVTDAFRETRSVIEEVENTPVLLHPASYWFAGEGDGWICIQPDNRKMVIVDVGVNFFWRKKIIFASYNPSFKPCVSAYLLQEVA
ncbi:unnamed protein product [Brassica oleracea var. botrytis]